uniref:Uncharacterized protein n=1 Tax=Anguilla anguilla TaxID=7936 RepID=A0A0E9PNX8_ANGAN
MGPIFSPRFEFIQRQTETICLPSPGAKLPAYSRHAAEGNDGNRWFCKTASVYRQSPDG